MDISKSILSPELLEATEALALTLLSAGPFIAYHRARARLDSDPQARELLERLSALQRDVRLHQADGGISQSDLERLRALQHQVQSNRVIVEYADTQQAAITYLPQINQEISQLIGMDFASLAGPASC
jgi:cell fate (sporulation/competence/biofilm development) regulator YlbF (YheA/YmcA/DUF963 family)